MKWSIDGDQVCVTKDDFINLQESPAVFVPCESEPGRAIEDNGILGMAVADLRAVWDLLNSGGGEYKEVIMEDLCLLIVRHDPERNVWVVDEYSRHHLEVKDGYDVVELRVATIRPLVKDVGAAATTDDE